MSDVKQPDIEFFYQNHQYGVCKDGNIWAKSSGVWRIPKWHNFKISGETPGMAIVPSFFLLALEVWKKLQNQKKHPVEVF